MELINQWWQQLLAGFARAQVPEVTAIELLIIALAAAALSIPATTWRYFGLFTTVVHELGHAFTALMTGRLLTGITLNRDHSGMTTSYGRGGWRTVWSGFWGYPVPAVVGAVLVWAGLSGWGPAATSVGALVLLATILFIRNWMGLLIMMGAVVVSAVLILAVPASFTGHVVIGLGLALLVGSVRDLINVITVHTSRRRSVDQSDAYLLYRQTHIPSVVWLLLFTVVVGLSWTFAGYVINSRI
ncbi:M50 family metallopeptidase [Arthrobacter roseus]|uniref:M50 family metallopeptidase n=1 Tax=Arthrobacter roseus TaxID=136274 RepID=UPI0019640E87|nr:hypothetical protein [Arthrobacter roseus]